MIDITEPVQIPTKGKVVVFVVFDTAPCRKFMNYVNVAIGKVLEAKEPTGNSYFKIINSTSVKEALRISSMPTCIVYVDGEEKTRFSGHFWSEFEIANKINQGFSK